MRHMTIAQARRHYGFAASVSDAAVIAAAEADGITITDAPGARRQTTTATADPATAAAGGGGGEGGDDDDDDDDDEGAGVSDLRSLVEELRAFREEIRTHPERGEGDAAERRLRSLESRIDQALSDSANNGLGTRGATTTPRVTVSSRFDDLGYTRGDYELAMMIFEGTWRVDRPTRVSPPEDFVRAWRHHVFETGGPVPTMVDADGRELRRLDPAADFTRAMDTAESGFGADLIGAQYVRDLWAAARNDDSLVERIPRITMTDPTTTIPVDGALPEMLFVGESTTHNATAYATSKTASSKRTLTAKKFTIQQIWSGELNEDSIIAFTPFLRRQLNASASLHLGSAFYNGDTTNAGTGNINSDDADPADTKHYLAWDGIRHYWLVDAAAQGKDMAGALDPKELWRARGRLNGTDDDIDAAVGNINWGTRAAELLTVADWDTFMELHDSPDFATVDKYGAQATVVTGELGRVNGMPVIAPGYASKTEADGKASGTEANNVKGQITVMNPNGFIYGVRREMQLYFDRIQRTDQFLFELYTRVGFNRWGSNVAAGVYDIDVSA